jgi:hypothetical protein
VALVALTFMYQRVMLINLIPTPKQPAALEDRATEMLGKLGYDTSRQASASGLTISLDYANFIASRATGRDRWKQLANGRPETMVFWHRTSPRPLVPWDEGRVSGTNPPLNVSGMTLIVVDASGRLSELIAIPEPFDIGVRISRPTGARCSKPRRSRCPHSSRSHPPSTRSCSPTSAWRGKAG